MSFCDAFRPVDTTQIYPGYTLFSPEFLAYITDQGHQCQVEWCPKGAQIWDCPNEVQGLTRLGLIAPGNKKLLGGNKISNPRLPESQLQSDQISVLSCFGFKLDLWPEELEFNRSIG